MFRTASGIRAGNGRSFIAENTSASSNEGHARSERRREALVASAKDFSDFWGRPVDLLEEHREECICVPFFLHTVAAIFSDRRAQTATKWSASRAPPSK